jgi:hypothetical protein
MAKYREAPTKPRTVEAVQFTGLSAGVPQFNEPMPEWLFAAFLDQSITISDVHENALEFTVVEQTVVPGSWLVRHDNGIVSHCSAVAFLDLYKPARKKPVRKPKALKAAA